MSVSGSLRLLGAHFFAGMAVEMQISDKNYGNDGPGGSESGYHDG